VIQTPGGQVTYEGAAAIDGVPGTAAPVKENFAGTVGSKTGKLLPTGRASEEIDGVGVTCIDVAVPMVIVAASALGKTGYESKAELDRDAALIARLERIRVEAGKRMGLGDCSHLVIPKTCVGRIAGRRQGTIASRDFVPFNCHATYSVTGSMALSAACMLPGTVAKSMAKLKGSARQTIAIEHPGGVIDVEVLAARSAINLRLKRQRCCARAASFLKGRFVFQPASGMGVAERVMQRSSRLRLSHPLATRHGPGTPRLAAVLAASL
jgi:2-methylaconitate cis-trans-isomerase PrpF